MTPTDQPKDAFVLETPVLQQAQAPPEKSNLHKNDLSDATSEELRTLRHVADRLPRKVWIALAAGGAERFTFYVVSTPWQNYMQNAPGDSATPGALGLGQSRATTIFNAYYMFSFLTPIFFAVLSDARLGRFKVLCISLSLYLCGTLVQFVTSLPSLFDHDAGVAGLTICLLFIGMGVGGTKATFTPFIGDQYPVKPPQVKTLPSKERVIIDRTLTLQYIYNVYYWITNVAAVSLIAATYLEKAYGFWSANLLAFCSSWVGLVCLLISSKEFEKLPAQGGVLLKAGKLLGCAIRGGFSLRAVQPEHQLQIHGRIVPWTNEFVLEIRSGLRACEIMLWFILFQTGMNQMNSNLVSQAGQMKLGGFPNDGIQVLNPIACVLLGPLIQKFLYPGLARLRIPFGPVMRIAAAFMMMAATFAYAAGVQKMIYDSGPCYDAPVKCPAASRPGQQPLPNDITVWTQTPLYALLALAEIFGFVTLSEYTYSMAPRDMRTVMQSLRLLSAGVGSAIGIALGPVSHDPNMIWLYASLAVCLGAMSPILWAVVGHRDKEDKDVDTLLLEQRQQEGRTQ
ncbi:MFS peptide transporter Ptr2 like protein [Zymoseptoria brevis]|uniref:MFS peptide transporter Ptr2 like protein n=1 Tax=Zymoseptoria brevis TaxID=1047168 RepID=A0A0F4GMC7_9PEZI|nr:MFS peptide transporter Ptr2 like protein [Zymoseptoria brevis]